ncbi:MAG: threonylcarbamoyl-AMP synthase [Loktanella sp.]|nr:threonylcarbamoyl-AMP synthase [Loktanella sp.]
MSNLVPSGPDAFSRAGELLRQGGLVAFPTETVYGLGADARDDGAVGRIYTAKGRPSFNPLIVHVSDLGTARTYVEFTPVAERLAAAFWPGALTLVLPLKAGSVISPLVTAGLGTLAVRVPDHSVAQAVLAAFGGPVAAPSANPSGRVSPTTAAHVVQGLGDAVDLIVDGGACGVGLESTIVDCTGTPRLLRAGGVPLHAIEACVGQPLAQQIDAHIPSAPGQLQSHYAPSGSVRLNVERPQADEVYLGFGPMQADLNLSPSGDLVEAAARLFACLHELDAKGAERIAVAPVPMIGLGLAINDRLKRAAAPRNA